MKYLLFSAAILLLSCKSEYKGLQRSGNTFDCLPKYGNDFQTAWYSATIDVYGKHLTGLLLIKNTKGGNYRTVFTSEAGVTYFDFAFYPSGGFEVKKVISQLDRKPVINTLKEDFALLMRLPFKGGKHTTYVRGEEIFHASIQKNGTAYFITDRDCASLRRLELGSRRQRKVSIVLGGDYDQPASAEITHHMFDMVIKLRKIEKE